MSRIRLISGRVFIRHRMLTAYLVLRAGVIAWASLKTDERLQSLGISLRVYGALKERQNFMNNDQCLPLYKLLVLRFRFRCC